MTIAAAYSASVPRGYNGCMCGRFVTPTEADIERYWNLRAPPEYCRPYNAAPSQPLWIIRNDADGQRELKRYGRGFQPTWAKRSWINARLKTVFSSKAFATARKRRCLVPAVAWYEWLARSGGKQPFVFHLPEFRPFAFAGIWTARETGTGWSHNFAIITRPAADEAIAAIHGRMPALVHPALRRVAIGRDE